MALIIKSLQCRLQETRVRCGWIAFFLACGVLWSRRGVDHVVLDFDIVRSARDIFCQKQHRPFRR